MSTHEDGIQQAIIEYLAMVTPQVIAYAIPNRAVRTRGGRAGNAVPGLYPGVFDVGLVLPDGRAAFIECKTATGVLSKDQKTFRARLAVAGVPYCVAVSIDDVREALDLWGVKTREVAS